MRGALAVVLRLRRGARTGGVPVNKFADVRMWTLRFTPKCRYIDGVPCDQMTAATRNEVLGLYRRIFRIARTWQSITGLTDDTLKEKQYIVMEAKVLFRKNKNLTDIEAIKNCITECHTRIEMGLHYRIPYPRPIHLPPMGLADKKGRKFKMQERLRKFAKPVYLQSHEEMD